jgi:hypothetical protein
VDVDDDGDEDDDVSDERWTDTADDCNGDDEDDEEEAEGKGEGGRETDDDDDDGDERVGEEKASTKLIPTSITTAPGLIQSETKRPNEKKDNEIMRVANDMTWRKTLAK